MSLSCDFDGGRMSALKLSKKKSIWTHYSLPLVNEEEFIRPKKEK